MPFDRSLLTFDAGRHRHLYDGKQLIGVTTALGMVSKGDGLVQWGVNQAVEHLQRSLCGSITKEQFDHEILEAKTAWRAKRQEAADIGSQAHGWVESYLRGENPSWPEHENVRLSCEAAVRWLDKHRWQTVEIEKQIYSPKYGYAGILDWWAFIDGIPAVPDWKTSKYLYPTYRYQTAAYVMALHEELGVMPRERWLLRIDKETGRFEDLRLPYKDLAPDFRCFKAALDLYKRDKELKEKAKDA